MTYAEFQKQIKASRNDIYREIFANNRDVIRVKKEGKVLTNLEKIFSATLKISNKKGFTAMSMRDLSYETGLSMGARALASGTAKLPVVELAGETGMPGKSTETAIRSGLLLGAAGAVTRLLADAGVGPQVPLYLTGQDAPHLAPHLDRPTRPQPGLGILGVALAVRSAPPTKRMV